MDVSDFNKNYLNTLLDKFSIENKQVFLLGDFNVNLQRKKDINQKSKVFVSHSLCPYYRFLWGKCKELQRKGRISQVFCLGAIVIVRIAKSSPAIKILHEKDLLVCQECPPESVKD